MVCLLMFECERWQAAPFWAKSWHQWGLFNLQLMQHYNLARQPEQAQRHVAPAVVGFFRSVALGQADGEWLWGEASIRFLK